LRVEKVLHVWGLVIGPSSLVDSFPVPCNFLLAPSFNPTPTRPHFTTDRLEPSSFQRALYVGGWGWNSSRS